MPQTIGHGSQLQLGVTVSGNTTLTTIAGVTGIDFGSDKTDTIDNTDMGTTGNTRTKIGGLFSPGDVTVKINVVPGDASQAALEAVVGTGVIQQWKAIYPGAVRTRTFSGIAVSLSESVPDDKLPTQSLKIEVTGPIVNS